MNRKGWRALCRYLGLETWKEVEQHGKKEGAEGKEGTDRREGELDGV